MDYAAIHSFASMTGGPFHTLKSLTGSKSSKCGKGATFESSNSRSSTMNTLIDCLQKNARGNVLPPVLRHVSSCTYGDRQMVVMDYVDGQPALSGTLSETHCDQVKRAIGRLHEEGIVFGDLRGQNIITEGDRVMLVDFDWCGKHGEAEYPIDLNDVASDWPAGAGSGQVMRKEHDYAMLKRLIYGHEP